MVFMQKNKVGYFFISPRTYYTRKPESSRFVTAYLPERNVWPPQSKFLTGGPAVRVMSSADGDPRAPGADAEKCDHGSGSGAKCGAFVSAASLFVAGMEAWCVSVHTVPSEVPSCGVPERLQKHVRGDCWRRRDESCVRI